MMIEPLIITAAICGAEVSRKEAPSLPVTAEELRPKPLPANKRGRQSSICMSATRQESRPRTGRFSERPSMR